MVSKKKLTKKQLAIKYNTKTKYIKTIKGKRHMVLPGFMNIPLE